MKSLLNFNNIFTSILFVFLIFNCSTQFRSAAQLLPLQEVEALEAISMKLQIKHWKLNQTFCTGGNVTTGKYDDIYSNVACNCTGTACHVTNIVLKRLNLIGELPAEFGNLSHLQELDLTRNFISGLIPTSFAQLPLIILSVGVNRISGSIPENIGNIATLEQLNLENNQLNGSLPRGLGKLSSLRLLQLSANNFTGTLPEELSNLKNLTQLRIDGSKLSGKIPDWIGNWSKITRLDMQGAFAEGPLPSTISELKNLTELRISDLNGSISAFPDLRGMTEMKYLILRNCLINGSLEDYIAGFTKLKILDLSFNRLTGEIPETFKDLDFDYMFLNNNLLNGRIPDWFRDRPRDFIDVSYNNFTDTTPVISCVSSNLNLASSISSSVNNSNSNVLWCLKQDLPCDNNHRYNNLFINCGGSKSTFEGEEYEPNPTTDGTSQFFVSDKWAYSSTGVFMGDTDGTSYIASNSFPYKLDEIYKTARLAPASLKYHGLCLRKGNYKVRLHFAEIMFSNDQTYRSLGKRIFDVSIQGVPFLKDFNIVEKAGSPGKAITMEKDVTVSGSTLEIHLYWSGKGTNAIPEKGVYGPLISAISVTPNYDYNTGLSVGAIVGIVAASFVALLLIFAVLRMKGYLGGKDLEANGT